MSPRRVAFHARDGLRLSALEYPGPAHRTPILCLSGLTRSAADFEVLAARHALTRRVIALDHAGHGESARPAEIARYGIPNSLADVLDAMAALHCPRAVVLGTSFGGILAMVLAVFRPTALAGLVLNDIGPHVEDIGLDHVQNFVGLDPALENLEACVAHLQRTLPPMPMDEAGWLRFAANTFAPGGDGRWHPRWDTRIAQVLRNSGKAPELWPAFGAAGHAPMMLVRGELSDLLSPETAARMRRERPDMTFVNVPRCGHSPMLDEPQVVPALDRFLHAIP
ncbi:alpha/beta fold hydrolase [Falsiroseomonas oryziterrae]|uniref:alpha/beta fold hydrolase n=1 Tax=Falsiroseomonas oryziterrae TaxID=2911368 RepID=UPI001F24C356|nr:alpha/beta hydrolase [Roseomonas sp. NPKOSM-4]